MPSIEEDTRLLTKLGEELGGFGPCPCCHGARRLLVHDAAYPASPPQHVICCHCSGTGIVGLELMPLPEATVGPRVGAADAFAEDNLARDVEAAAAERTLDVD